MMLHHARQDPVRGAAMVEAAQLRFRQLGAVPDAERSRL